MSRLWSCGLEQNSTTANGELTSFTGTYSLVTDPVHGGDYALRTNPSSATGYVTKTLFSTSTTAAHYFRFYLRIGTAVGTLTTIFSTNTASTTQLRLNSNNTLELWATISGSFQQVGSDSSALNTDTWYCLEIQSAGANVAARINAASAFASSASQTSFTFTSVNIGVQTSTTANLYFDDFAVNNTSGSFQTSYPGAGSIFHLHPNAAGDQTGWTPSTGSNYACVDETGFNTADYVYATTDTTDQYNLESCADAGITDITSITLVQAGAMVYSADYSWTTFYLGLEYSSTTEESAALTLSSSAAWYVNVWASGAYYYPLTLYDLPGASTTAWSESALNSTQIGVRLDQSFSTQGRCGTLWLLVEYVPTGMTTYVGTITSDAIILQQAVGSQTADGGVIDNVNYTYGLESSLPTDDSTLSSFFTSTDYSDVANVDDTRMDFEPSAIEAGYMVKMFRNRNSDNSSQITINWEGQVSIAPSSSTVYLQIYNFDSNSWETLDSKSSGNADEDFTLSGTKSASVSDYYESIGSYYWTLCRVYQQK